MPRATVQVWSGVETKALRTALRLTVDGFAAKLGVSPRIVFKWEKGKSATRPGPSNQEALDTLLLFADDQVHERFTGEVGLTMPPGVELPTGAMVGDRVPLYQHGAPDDEQMIDLRKTQEEGDDVKRQAFLRSLAVVAAGLAVGDPIADAIGRGMNSGAAPSRVGDADVEHVNHAIRMFDEWQDLYGGGICQDAIAGQVNWATQLLGASSTESVKSKLYSSVGFLINIAGWGAFDAGSHDRARRYFQAALQCAEEANDWGLRANVLSDMARQAIYTGRPDDGLSFVELAQVRQDRQVPAAQSMLSTVRARALAKAGRADDAYSAVAQAADYFSHRSAADDTPAWIAYFGPAELSGDSGHALTDVALGGHHVDAARQHLRASLDSYTPAQARARTFSLGKLALLELHAGDPEAGISYANASLDAEAPLTSRRAQDDLRNVYHALVQHESLAGVTDLRDRIGGALQGASKA